MRLFFTVLSVFSFLHSDESSIYLSQTKPNDNSVKFYSRDHKFLGWQVYPNENGEFIGCNVIRLSDLRKPIIIDCKTPPVYFLPNDGTRY